MFDNVYVNSQKGMVALSSLGTVQTARATPEIRRENKNRYTEIDIKIGKSTMGPVQQKIQAELNKIDWAPGYYAEFGGMSDTQAESASEIGMAFMLARPTTEEKRYPKIRRTDESGILPQHRRVCAARIGNP